VKPSFKSLLPLLLLLALPAAVRGQFFWTTNNGAITITSFNCVLFSGAVTIPDTITGLPVTRIGDYAFFEHCSGLTGVTLGTNVTSIGYLAFALCPGLTNVTMPGNSLTNIGDVAFGNCPRLTSVTIPNSVTSLGTNAFGSCTSLTNVTIGNSLTNIPYGTFELCTNLATVTIPNSVTSIGTYAFASCTRLAALYFQGNAPSLGVNVFSSDNSTIYYLPGTTNWGTTYGGRPTVLWNPAVQTTDATFGVRTNRFGFSITGASNLVIVVEACANPANPAWSPVGTNTLTGGSSYFSDPQWTNYPARCYRLRSP